jgi:hypothetical protein
VTVLFDQRTIIPKDVMVRDVAGETVLLNLNTGTYFGLNEVGTRMWYSLEQAGSVQEAFDTLISEYDVEPETLRKDLQKLIEDLVGHGLLVYAET